MAVAIGHFVMEMLVVVAFDEFDALVFESEVVAVWGGVASSDVGDGAVGIDDDVVKTVDGMPDGGVVGRRRKLGGAGFLGKVEGGGGEKEKGEGDEGAAREFHEKKDGVRNF